jgi:SPP1 gp7 family putative phage head morphogenesis protein
MAAKKLKKPLVWIYPKGIENSYQRTLLSLVRQWQELAEKIVISKIPQITSSAYANGNPISSNIISSDSLEFKNDDWVDDVNDIINVYTVSATALISSVIPFIRKVGSDISAFNMRQWRKIVKHSLDIDYFPQEPWLQTQLKSFNEQNITAIEKINNTTAEDMKSIINRGISQGKRPDIIRAELIRGTNTKVALFKKTKNSAQFIGRDQVSKLNGQLERMRESDIGVSTYVWLTRGDDRVRPTHRNMEGRECVWHNSDVYIGDDGKFKSREGINGVLLHPGQDFNCRCTAIPNFESVPDFEERFLL